MLRAKRAVMVLTAALAVALLANAGVAAALPTCLDRGGSDAQAKEEASTAQTTAETFSTDHDGFYTGLSLKVMRRYEPSLLISRAQAERDHGGSFLYAAIAIEHGDGYIVRTRTLSGDRYTILRARFGWIRRTAWQTGKRCSW
jgi:hypothetical protein